MGSTEGTVVSAVVAVAIVVVVAFGADDEAPGKTTEGEDEIIAVFEHSATEVATANLPVDCPEASFCFNS